MHTVGLVLVRPLFAMALLLVAAYLSRWLRRFMPDNALVRFLYKPRGATAAIAAVAASKAAKAASSGNQELRG